MQPLTHSIFEERIQAYTNGMYPVVPLQPGDKLLPMNFTAANTALTDALLKDTDAFGEYVSNQLAAAGARYGVGGYNEDRVIYRRSAIFGPSPQTGMQVQDGAKAPSHREGENESDESLVEEDTVGYKYADPFYYKLLKEHALRHRTAPTAAEETMWDVLKSKQFSGYKFRRQHIIDKYITDFVCLKRKLVIEIDGAIHQLTENKQSNAERTERLETLGFRVLRFTNKEVFNDLENVLNILLMALQETVVNPIPSEAGSPSHREGVGGWAARTIHLGLDIWGPAGTPVYAPLAGRVHSFAFNDAFGDYGATLVLQHRLDDFVFHTLYGHLSLLSIQHKKEGQHISAGEAVAWFGVPKENGHWPPHLHFQVIQNMQGNSGDYPGVCSYEDQSWYLENCPNPSLLFPEAGTGNE